MRKYFKSFNNLRFELRLIFFFSIATILFIDFYLINIPEMIPGGAKIGGIIYKLCFAFITSLIFYFFNIHIKQQRDKAHIQHYLEPRINGIIDTGIIILDSLAKAAKVDLIKKYPTPEQIEEICKNLNPNSDSPIVNMAGGHINWLQFIDYWKMRIEEKIVKIITVIPFVDHELAKIIAEIEDSSLFMNINMIKTMSPSLKTGNKDMLTFKDSIIHFNTWIERLDLYTQKHIKPS